jgi:hypothetical protein
MDPYLERPGLWEGVHTRLIVAIADALAPLVRPKYRVDVETRTYLAMLTPDEFVGKPDVLIFQPAGTLAGGVAPALAEIPMPEEMVERFLEIREVRTAEVITVIEILSPANKSNVTGRQEYHSKRQKVLGSQTHLIEIDLLRGGQSPPLRLRTDQPNDYRIVISRAWQRPQVEVYAFGIRQPIPTIPVPLRRQEAEPPLALNQLLHDLYDRAGYDLAIEYHQNPTPPLKGADAAWADELLRSAGLR